MSEKLQGYAKACSHTPVKDSRIIAQGKKYGEPGYRDLGSKVAGED